MNEVLHSKLMNITAGVLLAAIWGIFAYAHLLSFLDTREWSLLLFCLSETLGVCFYVFRRRPETVSVRLFDWVVAIAGTFIPLLFRPATEGILPADNLIIVGAVFQMLSLLSLNRSFALVAAKREIKTAWMYRVVRHPLYASYGLIFTGYLLTHTTTENLLVYLATMTLMCMRIFREESHIARDPVYREYMNRVQYRLIPFVF
ncbi:MAG: methyltransferase family protein [Methylobacter sp.]